MKKHQWFREFYERVEDHFQISNCALITRDMIFKASYYWKEGFKPHEAVRCYISYRETGVI